MVVFRALIACDTFSDVLNLYYVVRSTDFIYRYVKQGCDQIKIFEWFIVYFHVHYQASSAIVCPIFQSLLNMQ